MVTQYSMATTGGKVVKGGIVGALALWLSTLAMKIVPAEIATPEFQAGAVVVLTGVLMGIKNFAKTKWGDKFPWLALLSILLTVSLASCLTTGQKTTRTLTHPDGTVESVSFVQGTIATAGAKQAEGVGNFKATTSAKGASSTSVGGTATGSESPDISPVIEALIKALITTAAAAP